MKYTHLVHIWERLELRQELEIFVAQDNIRERCNVCKSASTIKRAKVKMIKLFGVHHIS